MQLLVGQLVHYQLGFHKGDITSIQKAFRELDKFTTASNAAREEIALGFDIELPEIGTLAKEAQEVLNVLTTLQPFLVSGAFDEFLKLQGFPDLFPDEDLTRGEQFFRILQLVASGAELTAEQLEVCTSGYGGIWPGNY